MSDNGQIDVGYVAGLARLELDPEAKARLQKDMEGILAYIKQLEELDVDGIEPTAHAALLTNVFVKMLPENPFSVQPCLRTRLRKSMKN